MDSLSIALIRTSNCARSSRASPWVLCPWSSCLPHGRCSIELCHWSYILLMPLEDRLARVLKTIPREVQAEGLSLSTIQTSLRGRWRGNAHPGELGAALRKLGFKRQRRWDDVSGFRALWFPEKLEPDAIRS